MENAAKRIIRYNPETKRIEESVSTEPEDVYCAYREQSSLAVRAGITKEVVQTIMLHPMKWFTTEPLEEFTPQSARTL